MPNPPTVAVVGLGAMGLPMATRLGERFTVRGYDVSPERVEEASRVGVEPSRSARAAVSGAAAVLLAVRNQADLVEVLYGTDGVADLLSRETPVILTSTVGIEAVQQVSERLAADDVELVDAPVSGGPARAGRGDLLIVVGASDEAFDRTHQILAHLASTLERMGPKPGDGQAMKTVNQLLAGVHIAAAAEALALADRLGLDRAQTLRTLSAGAGASFMLQDRGPRMLQSRDHDAVEVRSRLDIFVKDLELVSRATQSTGLAAPVSAAAQHLYLIGQAHGLAASDDSSVISVIAPT